MGNADRCRIANRLHKARLMVDPLNLVRAIAEQSSYLQRSTRQE